MINERKIPVFIINGFLESGKTTFITDALLSNPRMKDERVVIVCCEEGVEEYDSLPDNMYVHIIDEKDELTDDVFNEINKKYRPTYIIIEYNGVWGMQALYNTAMPLGWRMAEQLTVIDASTFESYFSNMKSIFADMLRASTTVFMNRCTREDDFRFFRDSIRPCAPQAEIVYLNDEEGNMNITLEDELPYNLSDDVITITDDSYVVWFFDMLDNPDRYVGKTVEFVAQAARPDYMRENFFAAGNQVMTCCEDDMQFLGFICHYEKAKFLKNGAVMKLRGEVHYEYTPEAGKDSPIIYITKSTTLPTGKKKK